jgi:hypothetical protein
MTISGINTQLKVILAHLSLTQCPDMFSLDEIPETIANNTYQILYTDILPNSEFGDKALHFTPQLTVKIEVVTRIGNLGITEYLASLAIMEQIIGHVLHPNNYAGAWKNVELRSGTHRVKDNWMIIECAFDMIYTLNY